MARELLVQLNQESQERWADDKASLEQAIKDDQNRLDPKSEEAWNNAILQRIKAEETQRDFWAEQAAQWKAGFVDVFETS